MEKETKIINWEIQKKIIGYNQCRFRRNRSTTDSIYFIRQIPEKKTSISKCISYL